jgi:hypothetical protein
MPYSAESKLARLAMEVAISAPAQLKPEQILVTIPRQLLDRIRGELDRNGVNWRKVCRELRTTRIRKPQQES